MSTPVNKKRCFDNLEPESEPHFAVKKRKNDFNARTWWMVDVGCPTETNQGATPLVRRCMLNYGWELDKAKTILKAYRQFLILTKQHQDWEASIFAPSRQVHQMWRQHVLDIGNYYHDMVLLCGGKLVLYNPDENLDHQTKKSREERTRTELIQKFGSKNVDRDIWDFPCKLATTIHEGSTTSPSGKLNIVVKDPSSGQTPIQITPKTCMRKVMGLYANKCEMDVSEVQFFYNGKRIRKDDTARRLDLEDGDTIDMIPTHPVA
jgi:hypothetical protein